MRGEGFGIGFPTLTGRSIGVNLTLGCFGIARGNQVKVWKLGPKVTELKVVGLNLGNERSNKNKSEPR